MGGDVSFHIEEDSNRQDAVRSGPVIDPVVNGTIIGQGTIDAAAASDGSWCA